MCVVITVFLRLDCLEDLVVMSKNIFGCDRDHLFLAWVKAEAKNPNKVEEIWMQIQVFLTLNRVSMGKSIHGIFKNLRLFCKMALRHG